MTSRDGARGPGTEARPRHAALSVLPPLPPLPAPAASAAPGVSPAPAVASRLPPPAPVGGHRAEVAAALAPAASALLARRADARRSAEDLSALQERVVRLGRRGGGRRAPGAPASADGAAGGGSLAVAPDAAGLAAVRAALDGAEARVRELSAAVSSGHAGRGRTSRRQLAEVERLRVALEAAQAEAAQVAESARRVLASARETLDAQLAADVANAHELVAAAPVVLGPWDLARWAAWEPGGVTSDELRVGSWREPVTGAVLGLPCVVPFPAGRGIEVVSHDDEQRAAGAELLQALALRAAAAGHGRIRLVLLDPLAAGGAFPGATELGATVPAPGDIAAAVRDLTLEAQRGGVPADGDHRGAHGVRVVVVADFPAAYDDATAAALRALVRGGPAGGVHVIVHRHAPDDASAPVAAPAAEGGPVVVDLRAPGAGCGEHRGELVVDRAPARALVDVVGHRLRATPLRDVPVLWHEMLADRRTWWADDADDALSVPLGRDLDEAPLSLWLGRREDRYWPCDHALVAAKPGAGRSTFLRTLVLSLAARYRPDDVHLTLVDARHGTDFAPFETLPHVALVARRTTPAQLRGIVADLVVDVRERAERFARHGVATLGDFRRSTRSTRRRGRVERVARRVVVIDGWEQLLDGDDGTGAAHLRELATAGGAAGVHLVLVGPSFRAATLVGRSDVFAHLQQRWALPLTGDDLAAAVELGTDGRLLAARHLDRPGRVVVNDHGGNEGAAKAGRVAVVDAGGVERAVRELAERARQEVAHRAWPATVVLDGLAPPELLADPHVRELLRNDCWHAADFLQELARTPRAAGGMGLDGWLAADRPLPVFVGVVDGGGRSAVALLRRRPGEHLVVVGEAHGAMAASLASVLVSAALVEGPSAWCVRVADRSPVAQSSAVLEQAARAVAGLGVDVAYGRDEDHATAVLHAAATEVARRRALPAADLASLPTMLVVLAEPDRVRAFGRVADGGDADDGERGDDGLVDSAAGADLRRVLVGGPAVGVHVVVGATSLPVLRSVVDEALVRREVRHRFVFATTEDDSFALVGSAVAARLAEPDASPPIAVLYDAHRDVAAHVRPYVADHDEPLARPPAHGSFADQVRQVCAHLGARSA